MGPQTNIDMLKFRLTTHSRADVFGMRRKRALNSNVSAPLVPGGLTTISNGIAAARDFGQRPYTSLNAVIPLPCSLYP